MHNPYSHTAAPATPELQKLSDYERAVGENAAYYVPKFEEYDKGASKLGWHWPAFFATTPWFCYRKMWGWGIGNVAWFWGMLTFVLPIGMGIAAAAAGNEREPTAVFVVAGVVVLLMAAPWFLLPLFANALYWRHINKVIRNIPASIAQQPDKRAARITRNGGTGTGAMVGVLVGGVFFLVVIVGILAAIAIPAYHDYTIRGQVVESDKLAAPARAAVTMYYTQNDAWPENDAAAEFSAERGKYVQSVTIERGSVIVEFNSDVENELRGRFVIYSPGIDAQKRVIWMCADNEDPRVIERGPGPIGTDVPHKYLPADCRPAAGT
jgi:Tfp pilus assembly major pilin PilA